MGRLSAALDVIFERRPAPGSPWQLGPIASRRREGAAVTVGVFVYRGVSSAEVDEPVTKLAERMQADIVLVGPAVGEIHAIEPSRRIVVDHVAATAPPIDVLVVPGGLGWKQVLDDPEQRRWLAEAAGSTRAVLAMSTGSLLLASVGRLEGREATGHWLAERDLAALGATVTSTRTASDDDGRIVTTSGALATMAIIDEFADHARWAEWMPDA